MSQSQSYSSSSSSSSPDSDLDKDSGCCSSNRSDATATATAELKLYRAFIFSVPIFFTIILLFLFYFFYLRPRRVDWSSLRMTPFPLPHLTHNAISTNDLGLKKELREMLPIIVYKESFFVKDTQCSVCLLDYESEDRLQQIPGCGHTFHMSCIDLWLSNHSTCPLCRLSLLTTAKASTETSNMQNNEETHRPLSTEELHVMEFSGHEETTVIQNVSGEIAIGAHCIVVEGQNAQINQ